MSATYQYKAFISYRHTAHDKVIAEKLQKRLESYKPPKGLDRKEKWKIFRDETELSSNSDLSDHIKEALRNSEFLIVVCSETTKDSKWCREELEFFKALHMGSTDRIIPLVTSGDPTEVFPPALLTTTVLDEETGEYIEREVEPLAANVSADTLKGSLSALKTEYLRVAAPLLYCGYDNLFLRDRRRRRRRILAAGASVTAAVVLFTLYTLSMLMKISSQNADLEKKNYELDLSNSNLTTAYSNLDSANAELTKMNSDLDIANSDLLKSNVALEDANTDLKNANTALDNSNAELSQKKKDLENVNSQLQKTNTDLDNSNAELQKTNTALDQSNLELIDTNAALEIAKRNAEDREEEAIEARGVAEQRRRQAEAAEAEARAAAAEARAAEEKAKAAEKTAKEAEADAVEAWKAEEQARLDAVDAWKSEEQARLDAEEKNRQLIKANAEISAANADSTFSYNYDRIGALQQAISTPLYEEDDADILPSTTYFLNKALYTMTVTTDPRLTHSLDAQGYIKDFWFSPENNYVIACGNAKFVNIFDTLSGEIIYSEFDETLFDARLIDESHVVLVYYSVIRCVDFITGEEQWSRSAADISRKTVDSFAFCDFSEDFSRVALWSYRGYFAFLDTQSGETIDTYKTSGFMDGFNAGKQEDFSDGVHFSTVCFKNSGEDKNHYIISYDLSKKRGTTISMGNHYVYSTHGVGSSYIAAAYYVPIGDNDYRTELSVYDRLTTKLKTRVVLYGSFMTDLEVAETITIDKNGVKTDYAAAFGTRVYDNRSVVYFVDIMTGETITYYANSKVMRVEQGSEKDGTVKIFTENGDMYLYHLLTEDSTLYKRTYDSDTSHADGSVKIIWTDSDLVGVLGKSSSKICIYRVVSDPDIETVFENAYGLYWVLESDRYIVAINEDAGYVLSKENKDFYYTLDTHIGQDDIPVIYQSYLVSVNRNDNAIHAYSLDDYGALAWQHKIDSHNSIESYSLDVSQDGETLVAVTPYSICRVTGSESFETISHMYPVPSEDRVNWYVSINPNGKNIILQYGIWDYSSQNLPYIRYWCKYDFETEEWAILAEERKSMLVNAQDMTTFSDDGLLAAVPLSNKIVIVRVDDNSMVSEIPLANEIVSGLIFETDGDKLLVLFENGYMSEFGVSTGDELRPAVMLPASVFSTETFTDNYRKINLRINEANNELLIFHDNYACFVDLTYFEIISETFDESVTIYDLNDITQKIILSDGNGNLVLIPHYSKEYLFEKAGQLVNSGG